MPLMRSERPRGRVKLTVTVSGLGWFAIAVGDYRVRLGNGYIIFYDSATFSLNGYIIESCSFVFRTI